MHRRVKRRIRWIKRWTLAAVCLLCTLASAGCLQTKGVEQSCYVLGVGFDRGEKLTYRYTFMLQKIGSSSEGEKASGFTLVSGEGDTLFEAASALSTTLPFELSFVRTTFFVIEQSLVSERTFFEELLDASMSRLLIRYNTNLFISLCPAADAVQGLETQIDPNMGKIQENLANFSSETGLIPMLNLTQLLESMRSRPFDVAIPICGYAADDPGSMQDSVGNDAYAYLGGNMIATTDMKTEIAGSAIFSDGAMVGTLSGQNTMLLQMAAGDFEEGRLQLPGAEGKVISVALRRKSDPKVTFHPAEPPMAEITVTLSGYVEQPEKNGSSGGDTAETERYIESYLSQRYEQLFLACRKLRTDVFGLKKSAVVHFRSKAEWEAYDFDAAYARTEPVIDVSVQLKTPPYLTGTE